MQFWSGTAFMQTSDVLAVARMFDEAGYDGIVCSDHMIYPRALGLTPHFPVPSRWLMALLQRKLDGDAVWSLVVMKHE